MVQKALQYQDYSTYLALEKEADVKYEFHDGFIVAMAGGTLAHGKITANLSGALAGQLKDSDCSIYSSDVKIRIDATNRTFYPDLSIGCGKEIVSDQDPNALTNPLLIIEVLSESTESFDRGNKFTHYRQLSSFREYVLVSQAEPQVDVFYLTENGTWEIKTIIGLERTLELKSVGCKITIADIYRRVEGISV